MKTSRYLPALLGLLMLGSCKSLEVPDLNNPELTTQPTRSTMIAAATGLLVGARGNQGSQNGYVAMLGILGREGYNFDPADPRFVTEMLVGPNLDGGSPAFGGNMWVLPYNNVRNANVLLAATTTIATDPAAGFTAVEKEAIRGFTKTIQALAFLEIINTRDSNGAPIDVDLAPTADPAPIATRAAVFTHIVNLLDSAQTHLLAGGTDFPFPLGPGFSGFDTPATFLKVNRALRARVAVYLNDFTGALTALGASFIDPTQSLSLGAYHAFGTGSGDVTNALYDPQRRAIFAHPSLQTDAQARTSATNCVTGAVVASAGLDCRFQTKTVTLPGPKTVQGITTTLAFNIYRSNVDLVPIIRNEELILLRAEANIGAGNLAAAVTDLNTIRVTAGGLPAYSGAVTAAALLDELLYNKRYSLLFEGGHRWIDMRHYNRLATLPKDLAAHVRYSRFPFPINECNPRATAPTGCGTQLGF
jgi:hypothetical protein